VQVLATETGTTRECLYEPQSDQITHTLVSNKEASSVVSSGMLYHGQLFRNICYEILIQEPLERGPKLEDPDYKPRVGYLLPLQHVLIRASSYQLGSS
jgi:hypothetical protein